MTDLLKLEHRGHVAIITITNPPANTWTVDSLDGLRNLVGQLNADDNNYSLVITGEGEKFFSAGADLKQFASPDKRPAQEGSRAFRQAFDALANYNGVSIAAINGYAMGGGLECAMACDIRIAEEQAQMALPEAGVGLLPCGLGTQHLTMLVGEGWAKRMMLCNERLKAAKACEIGLVEEVVATGESLNAAIALAEKVNKQSPTSVKAVKKLIMGSRHQPMAEMFEIESQAFVDLFGTEDQVEGVNAFLEKRAPEWKNK
jgi:enoyl-CoA hydratase/carnithine racemase